MIESIMYCGIGFLFAALIGLAVFPLVRGRAVRLTMRRLQHAIPLSMTEIQADKDLLRAEFAMSTRRLEMSVDRLKNKTTSELAELAKKGDAINTLKIEQDEKNVEIIALKTQVEALKERLTTVGNEINAATDGHPSDSVPTYSSPRPPLSDQRHEDDVVSVIPKESPTAEENRLGGPVRDPDGRRDSPDQSVGMARKGSGFSAGLRAVEPPIYVSPRPSGSVNDEFVNDGPSIGKRIFRGLAGFFITVLLGVGATVAWQSYGNELREMVRTWAPSLGWLLPASTAKLLPDAAAVPAQTGSIPSGQAPREAAALPQSTLVIQRPAPPATAMSSEVVQQLEAMVRDLAVVRRSVQQLADTQEQMAQNIATLQAVEQNIRQKTSSLPLPNRAKLTPWPETRPTTIAGWTLRQVTNGTAVLEGPNGIWRAARGDTVPGVGRVDSIVRWGNRWIVATSRGLISTP